MKIGTISARGQVAIPAKMRRELGWKDGDEVLFMVHEGSLLLRKADFSQLAAPFRSAAKKAGLKEKDVSRIVQKVRRSRRTPTS